MAGEETHDVIIVGGSFAGLGAAMQLGRTRRRIVVVDAGNPRNRFAHASHGFLGQDGRSPAEILDTFRAQILAYPTVSFVSGEAVDARRADGDADGFAVVLASGAELRARRLVLATGVVDELPAVPGVAERWGVTVLHCPYCHGYEVADRRLGVLATSAMSAHQVILLGDWSGDVTFFANGIELDAEQRRAIEGRGARIEERRVVELVGEAPAICGVRIEDGSVVAVDAVFTGSRTRMASPLAERLGCAFDDGPFGPIVRTDERRQSTVPGVYCAGDAARAPHNAMWAAGDGATAGIGAHQSLVFESGTAAGTAPRTGR